MEEIETLEFTYDQPFHMSQRHSKLSINQRKPSGKCSNGKLRTSTLVNDVTLRSIANFVSALSNVRMLIMLEILRYLICLRFL